MQCLGQRSRNRGCGIKGLLLHANKQTHTCALASQTHTEATMCTSVCVCVCVYTSARVLDWVLQTANYLTKERQEKGDLYAGKAAATGLSTVEQLRPATTGRPFHLPGFPKVGQTTEACKQHGEPIVSRVSKILGELRTQTKRLVCPYTLAGCIHSPPTTMGSQKPGQCLGQNKDAVCYVTPRVTREQTKMETRKEHC